MASNTRPRQPRLRASCDGCFIAKVKCSKARPICSRCLACGLECRYSPSSRAGKPRYDAHNAAAQQHGLSHQGMGRVPEDGSIMYHTYAPPIDLYRLDTGWNTPPSLDGTIGQGPGVVPGAAMYTLNDQARSDHDGAMNLYGIGVSPWLSAADVQHSPFSELSFNQSSFTPNIARSPYSEAGLSIPPVSPWAVAGNGSSHEAKLYDVSNSLPTPVSMGSNCFPSPSATPSVPNCHQSGMAGPAAGTSTTCTCVSFCLESLQDLHNASATSTPSLDMILSLNRKAVESCAALLSCPRCTKPSGTPTAAMIFATILGEAAGFYKIAAHMHFDKAWGVSPNSPLPPSLHEGDTGPAARQGQEALWVELETLARELERLEEVCFRFRDICNDLSDDAEVNRAMVGYVSRTVSGTMEAIERRQVTRYA